MRLETVPNDGQGLSFSDTVSSFVWRTIRVVFAEGRCYWLGAESAR